MTMRLLVTQLASPNFQSEHQEMIEQKNKTDLHEYRTLLLMTILAQLDSQISGF